MNFPKIFSVCLILLIACFFSACSKKAVNEPQSKIILTSIPPYKYFVEQIAGDTVKVMVVVPAGGSPHSYEPTARQILEASKADAWFQIGEMFEARAMPALKSARPGMLMIDMREGLDLLAVDHDHDHGHCPHHECYDPHIWLSPRLVKKQAEVITDTLIRLYPEHTKRYQERLLGFQQKLDDLDKEIADTLSKMKIRTLLVSHPAFGYLCHDYGMEQLSIEFEGKDPTPHHLTEVLDIARKMKIPFVFVQEQTQGKGARLVAKEIGAQVIDLDPLAEDWLDNMQHIARSFAGQ